jgi:hypothetical protein
MNPKTRRGKGLLSITILKGVQSCRSQELINNASQGSALYLQLAELRSGNIVF